jgi:hypothetical protein
MKTMAMKLLRRIGGDWFWGRWRRSTLVLFSSGFSLVFFFEMMKPLYSPSFPSLFFLFFSPVFPFQRFLAWLLGWRRWWADDGFGSAGAVLMENGSGCWDEEDDELTMALAVLVRLWLRMAAVLPLF